MVMRELEKLLGWRRVLTVRGTVLRFITVMLTSTLSRLKDRYRSPVLVISWLSWSYSFKAAEKLALSSRGVSRVRLTATRLILFTEDSGPEMTTDSSDNTGAAA